MGRPDEAVIIKAMKEAKTVKDIVYSWGAQSPGRPLEELYQLVKTFGDKYPWIPDYYCQQGQIHFLEGGVLDRRTRELVIIGGSMIRKVPGGAMGHICNALSVGVTWDEIVAVAECACYVFTKIMCMHNLETLKEGFEFAKNVTPAKP